MERPLVRRIRRHRHALVGALCVLGATLLVLLAVDAHTWNTTVARDDVRFRALPAHRDLWTPSTLLPGDPAAALIGTGGTMTFRQALQYFWYSRVGHAAGTQDAETLRATTQNRLESLMSSGLDTGKRSLAANLLGVLVVTTPAPSNDSDAVRQILVRARGYFQQAIAIDPANADAKQNLELVLRLQRPGKGKLGNDARRGFGFGRGRAAGTGGSGY
jgi:hypothetical protein